MLCNTSRLDFLQTDFNLWLEADYQPKRNGSVESMIGGFQMYDEIREYIAQKTDIPVMLHGAL